jgi:RND family efflux transporter MFP subunit
MLQQLPDIGPRGGEQSMRTGILLAPLALGLMLLLPAVVPASDGLDLAAARYRQVEREYLANGLVEAVNQSTVSAQTSGRVSEILVDVNDFVARGATIVRLRDSEQRAALAQAEAGLDEARARLGKAEAEYQRTRKVYQKRLVSKAELDNAAAEREAARARLSAAEARVTQVTEALSYTVVEAPYSGIVLGRHVEVGEVVQPGSPLVTGLSLEQLRVVAQVPQRLIADVRRLGRAQILLGADAAGLQASRLTFFPYADSATSTFKVRVYLPTGTPDVYPGMAVKVAFAVGDRRQLVVPVRAIVHRSEVTGVYTVEPDGNIRFRQLRVGRSAGGAVEVLAGLEEGEQVALDPIQAGRLLKQRAQPDPGA